MDKENAIIIDGVKHILVNNTKPYNNCEDCSLLHLCCKLAAEYICEDIFDIKDKHFEINRIPS